VMSTRNCCSFRTPPSGNVADTNPSRCCGGAPQLWRVRTAFPAGRNSALTDPSRRLVAAPIRDVARLDKSGAAGAPAMGCTNPEDQTISRDSGTSSGNRPWSRTRRQAGAGCPW
jgi:hypothetical protein